MNMEDVFRIAEECGLFDLMEGMNLEKQNEAVVDFADMITAKEREECLMICREWDTTKQAENIIKERFIHA